MQLVDDSLVTFEGVCWRKEGGKMILKRSKCLLWDKTVHEASRHECVWRECHDLYIAMEVLDPNMPDVNVTIFISHERSWHEYVGHESMVQAIHSYEGSWNNCLAWMSRVMYSHEGSWHNISRSKYWSASGPSSSRLPSTHPLLVLTISYPRQVCFIDCP